MTYRTSRIHRTRLLSPWAVLLFVLTFAACDSAKVVNRGPGEQGNNGGSSGKTEEGTDDAGHGPDPDQELIEAGFMTGSWRVADTADGALVANFDLVQENESETLEGYYTMGSAIYDRLDGKSGDISSASTYDGQQLLLKWNPSDQPDEMYVIDAQKTDQDTFEGRLTALEYEQLDREVVITRYHFGGAEE